MLPWNVSSRDAQMAEFLKLSEEHIALAYRIPLQILGLGGASPGGSTEILMQSWVATGLGFALNHIEEAYGLFFRLRGPPYDYIELSTDSLLRSAEKDRIDALVKGVQGGIYSPNDARNMESLELGAVRRRAARPAASRAALGRRQNPTRARPARRAASRAAAASEKGA